MVRKGVAVAAPVALNHDLAMAQENYFARAYAQLLLLDRNDWSEYDHIHTYIVAHGGSSMEHPSADSYKCFTAYCSK